MGAFEQQWFCRSVGMNVCGSAAEVLHCNTDNGIVSLRSSIDPMVITTKSRPTSPILPAAPSAQSAKPTVLPPALPHFSRPDRHKIRTSSPSKIRLSSAP